MCEGGWCVSCVFLLFISFFLKVRVYARKAHSSFKLSFSPNIRETWVNKMNVQQENVVHSIVLTIFFLLFSEVVVCVIFYVNDD